MHPGIPSGQESHLARNPIWPGILSGLFIDGKMTPDQITKDDRPVPIRMVVAMGCADLLSTQSPSNIRGQDTLKTLVNIVRPKSLPFLPAWPPVSNDDITDGVSSISKSIGNEWFDFLMTRLFFGVKPNPQRLANVSSRLRFPASRNVVICLGRNTMKLLKSFPTEESFHPLISEKIVDRW